MNGSNRASGAETKTSIGRTLGSLTSKPYKIDIKGDRIIVQAGKVEKMQCTGSLIEKTKCD